MNITTATVIATTRREDTDMLSQSTRDMSADTHKDLKVKLETFTKSELIGALMRVAELSALKAGGWGVSEMKFARKLCSAERDRMTSGRNLHR